MSVKRSSAIWELSTAVGNDRLVMLALADHADDDGYCWPSIPLIARKAGCSTRTVIRIIQRCEEAGELYVEHARGRGNKNEYLVLPGLSEEAIKAALVRRFDKTPLEAAAIACLKRDTAMSPFDSTIKGDNRAIKRDTVAQNVTPVQLKRDTAMSPEPSVEPSKNQKDGADAPPPKVSEDKHPAIVAFKDTFKRSPTKLQRPLVIAAVGDSEASLRLWREVLTAWLMKTNDPTNITGMLDWFRTGIPSYAQARASPNGYRRGKWRDPTIAPRTDPVPDEEKVRKYLAEVERMNAGTI